ncbi:MAG: arsenic efflux protein [Bacteroidales bacterium]|nr:arsenic efflux protein [Lachnoclostridium sp.]MCM1384745.1 arsenic efflux protein [Lachnoclostridium sp.]MCM1465241.1 arsenic efflux protein [Bacteroidales bacterium]
MMEALLKICLDACTDTIKLIPFLFLAYLAMEYLEHKMGERTQNFVERAGKWGPLVGGLAGVVPQCGFSAAASNLYAGKLITLGTLLAIYLSTSDEMLPILISSSDADRASTGIILKILLMKAVIGIVAGFIVDMLFKKKEEHFHIHDICEQEHCHCEEGVWRSAIRHTLKIASFLLVITFLLNLAIHFIGEDTLGNLLTNRPFLGPILAGMVGLIPNCGASVVITQLYLKGALEAGAMMSGLLVGAGVGLLVLFRVNHNRKENLKVVGLLYLIGVTAGIFIGFLPWKI